MSQQTESYITPPSRYEITAICPSCLRDVRVLVPIEANSRKFCEVLEERLRRAKGVIIDKDKEIMRYRDAIERAAINLEKINGSGYEIYQLLKALDR